VSCELGLDDIVTEFLLNTCRPCTSATSEHAVDAAVHCGIIATNDERIPLTTGSAAEFYIEPILPHLGDIDVMFHLNTELAIPRGHPPPTQLPTYQLSLTTMSRYMRLLTEYRALLTVTYLAMCT